MNKTCRTCRFEKLDDDVEPCSSCHDVGPSGWAPQEGVEPSPAKLPPTTAIEVLRKLRDEIGKKITNAIEQQVSEWEYAKFERDTWYVREVAHTEDANLIDIEIRRLEKESKS